MLSVRWTHPHDAVPVHRFLNFSIDFPVEIPIATASQPGHWDISDPMRLEAEPGPNHAPDLCCGYLSPFEDV